MKHLCLGILLLGATGAWAQDDNQVKVIHETSHGRQVMRHEVTVEADAQTVWDLFTTKKGVETWITPFADIDFRNGGIGETSYNPKAKKGDEENILYRYKNIKPLMSYESSLVRPPKNNPYGAVLMDLDNKVSLQDLGDGKLKVSIEMIGWLDNEEHKKVKAFFVQGNSWYCDRLIKRLKQGPLPFPTSN